MRLKKIELEAILFEVSHVCNDILGSLSRTRSYMSDKRSHADLIASLRLMAQRCESLVDKASDSLWLAEDLWDDEPSS